VAKKKPQDPDYIRGWRDAAKRLAEPYPEEIFTPLSDDELSAAVDAVTLKVRAGSDRLHASWARHWSKLLLEESEP
jgi:hypothetical protein